MPVGAVIRVKGQASVPLRSDIHCLACHAATISVDEDDLVM